MVVAVIPVVLPTPSPASPFSLALSAVPISVHIAVLIAAFSLVSPLIVLRGIIVMHKELLGQIGVELPYAVLGLSLLRLGFLFLVEDLLILPFVLPPKFIVLIPSIIVNNFRLNGLIGISLEGVDLILVVAVVLFAVEELVRIVVVIVLVLLTSLVVSFVVLPLAAHVLLFVVAVVSFFALVVFSVVIPSSTVFLVVGVSIPVVLLAPPVSPPASASIVISEVRILFGVVVVLPVVAMVVV